MRRARATLAALALALAAPAPAPAPPPTPTPPRPPSPLAGPDALEILKSNLEDIDHNLSDEYRKLQKRLADIRVDSHRRRDARMGTLKAGIEALTAKERRAAAETATREAEARDARNAWMTVQVQLELMKARLEEMEAWPPDTTPLPTVKDRP